jgi:hypothetical protein
MILNRESLMRTKIPTAPMSWTDLLRLQQYLAVSQGNIGKIDLRENFRKIILNELITKHKIRNWLLGRNSRRNKHIMF